jgi:hypothetical protein
MRGRGIGRDQRGQGTVEWVGLILIVALATAALGALVGVALPGSALAEAVASRIVCAVGLSGSCDAGESDLALAYGAELAELAVGLAPEIRYEDGMRALPVDYRRCREDACAEGADSGEVWRTRIGERVTAFLRVIDCRAGSPTRAEPPIDCSGERSGNVYLQYWLYYPGSATGEGSVVPNVVRDVSTVVGSPSYHPDDWESLQIRIGPDGAYARASSHRGYGDGWLPLGLAYRVSGGSHAGTLMPRDFARSTPADRLRLVPLEPIAARGPRAEFAVTPPWLKRVWLDPEYEGTD